MSELIDHEDLHAWLLTLCSQYNDRMRTSTYTPQGLVRLYTVKVPRAHIYVRSYGLPPHHYELEFQVGASESIDDLVINEIPISAKLDKRADLVMREVTWLINNYS